MRIDIVTINLNNKKGLERTIRSVLSQTLFDVVNYIIIDGGSTDGSKELIEQHSDKLKYWCSEKDNGIFDAFNKGISHLSSDYVLFLNSGDFLNNNKVIEDVMPYLDGTDIVYGNELFWKTNHVIVSYVNADYVVKSEGKYPDKLTEMFFKVSALPHQSTFVKTSLQIKHKYPNKYKIAGDWVFLRESIMEKGATYKHIPMIVSCYNIEGLSARNQELFKQEKNDYYKSKDK